MRSNSFKSKPKEKKSFKLKISFFSDKKVKIILGIILLFTGFFLLLAFLSYLSHGPADQSVVSAFLDVKIKDSGKEVANLFGVMGALAAHYFIFNWFGLGAFLIPFFLLNLAVTVLGYNKIFKIQKSFIFTAFYLIWLTLLLGYIVLNRNEPGALGFLCGGIGYEMAWLINSLLGWGSGFLILLLLVIFNIYFFNITDLNSVTKWINHLHPLWLSLTRALKSEENSVIQTDENMKSVIAKVKEEVALEDQLKAEKSTKENIEETETIPPDVQEIELSIDNPSKKEPLGRPDLHLIVKPEKKEIESVKPESLALEVNSRLTKEKVTDQAKNYDPTLDLPKYQYPMIDLLTEYPIKDVKVSKEELESNKNNILSTLINFKIAISSIKATIGPTVTLYEIVPEAGVKISKIKNLEDDIALSLSALGIRIIAPIPGKGTIGIEVPNKNREMVSAKSVITTEKFLKSDYELPIVLGKTISNEVFVTDLSKMPHLLMAGATGQGKSVGLNIILASLIYKKHPSQLKFVLVDPKKVELTLFNKIEKHFLAKLPETDEAIITDTTKVVNTLNSLCIEMDARYDLLKDAGCRNLKEYNKKFINRRLNPKKGHKYLPYIVLVIDELADLMMTAGKEVEMPIARLAQLARAIGIHLIVATQRPSVNVITGIIKANFPARLSFRVTSKIDSRTILDAGGAEQLVGMGDMLLSLGSDMIRLQCAFLDTPEVENICDFIAEQHGYSSAYLLPEYLGEESSSSINTDLSDKDIMFDDAARLIVSHQQGSTSLIQRKMKLGYNRAGRIIDQLEAAGIVGPFEGSKAREVLISDQYSLEQKLNELKN
ncbi:MAG: cell division protein FtsK [Flammeovirgaceae bacterium]|nr:cell division protein FtsK [Flammeovirgaceae bacterium]